MPYSGRRLLQVDAKPDVIIAVTSRGAVELKKLAGLRSLRTNDGALDAMRRRTSYTQETALLAKSAASADLISN
jgi:hypothetical protein